MNDRLPTNRLPIAAALAVATLAASCGSRYGPSEANYLPPISVTGCQQALDDGPPADQRSLAAMAAALHGARYEIYQVSPVEFKIYTEFREIRGITVGWEAQIYSDGSAQLVLPATTPLQPVSDLQRIEGWGRRVASYFDRFKCLPFDELRAKSAAAGYPF